MKERVLIVGPSRAVSSSAARVLARAGSAAFLFAGLGPRIMLAPEGEGGGGDGGGSAAGGGGEAGAGAGGAAGAAGAAGGADGSGGDAAGGKGGEPSLLGSAPKPGTSADGNAPAGAGPKGERKTGDRDLGEDGKPKAKEGDPPPADDKPKDIDGNVIPEAYEFKMPDGFTADKALLDIATPVFKEHRLSPAQAQAVGDLYAQITKDQVTKHMDTVKGWRDRAKTDPALIADGGYDRNLALAHKGFQAFGNEELLQVFDTYGLGDHPAVLRAFRDMGIAVGETGTIGGDAATGSQSAADLFYPSMRKK